jgi:hypothetical protein
MMSIVVGHFKTILILTLGYVAFSQEVNYTYVMAPLHSRSSNPLLLLPIFMLCRWLGWDVNRNLFGVTVAVIGMILYGEIKRREGLAAAASARPPTSIAAVVAERDRVDTSSDRAATANGNIIQLEPLLRVVDKPQDQAR